MRFAYADPPYIGQARKHYRREAERDGREAKEVNHPLLIAHLCEFDAWALSCSSPTLQRILAMCPDDVRVCAWVKPFASFKPGVNPGYAWEPIIVRGGRNLGRDVPTVRDYVSCPITLKKGLSGVKPQQFCYWLFDFVGLTAADEFMDVFPGSGAVTRAWEAWKIQPRFAA